MYNTKSIIYDIIKSLVFTNVFGIQRIWDSLLYFLDEFVEDEESIEVMLKTCKAERTTGNRLHYGITKKNLINYILPRFTVESHNTWLITSRNSNINSQEIKEKIFEKILNIEEIQQVFDILTAIVYNPKIKKLQKIQAIVFILTKITDNFPDNEYLWDIANYYFLYEDIEIGFKRFCGEFWNYKKQNS